MKIMSARGGKWFKYGVVAHHERKSLSMRYMPHVPFANHAHSIYN